MMPINALQRTRPSRFGRNSRVPWAGSLVRRAERMVLGDFEQKETKRTKGRPTSLFPTTEETFAWHFPH